MGIKDLFGNKTKGVDCTEDESGNLQCRIMVKKGNQKLATGSEFVGSLDNNCKFISTGRWSVFGDDEEVVARTIKKAEADCKGGIN